MAQTGQWSTSSPLLVLAALLCAAVLNTMMDLTSLLHELKRTDRPEHSTVNSATPATRQPRIQTSSTQAAQQLQIPLTTNVEVAKGAVSLHSWQCGTMVSCPKIRKGRPATKESALGSGIPSADSIESIFEADSAYRKHQRDPLTIYKMYHKDLGTPAQVTGFDWGNGRGLEFPFVEHGDVLFEPPVRGFRLGGPALLPRHAEHLDLLTLAPALASNSWLQTQLSEFSGILAIANALEARDPGVADLADADPSENSAWASTKDFSGVNRAKSERQNRVPRQCSIEAAASHLANRSLSNEQESSCMTRFEKRYESQSPWVHWTEWIGFTSWKDVKLGRLDWEHVTRANPYHGPRSVYAWFNVIPECNPGSHRPAAHLCAPRGECHGGAVCDPGAHMDASFPGMRAYLPGLWQRTFGHVLPPLPPSAAQQVVWSTRLVMHTRWLLRLARALRMLAATMLADMEALAVTAQQTRLQQQKQPVAEGGFVFVRSAAGGLTRVHASEAPGAAAAAAAGPAPPTAAPALSISELLCPFQQAPKFVDYDFATIDPNPSRCIAMLLERAVNHWLVGAGLQTVMVLPKAEAGDWSPVKYAVSSAADLQPMFPEAWGVPSAPYLHALPGPSPASA